VYECARIRLCEYESTKFPYLRTVIKQIEIAVNPDQVDDSPFILKRLSSKLKVASEDIWDWKVARRSIDARGRRPLYRLRIDVYIEERIPALSPPLSTMNDVRARPEVVIIGAGPAGYFAGIEAIQLGLKPIILERGKKVQDRRRDLKAIQQDGEVNPHSNYCFGEGGAGTYSDGKLYTRSHKRGNIQEILELLVAHGASTDILIDAHPHIGSNKLPKIISKMRETIEQYGGEVRFSHFVTDILIKDHKVTGIQCAGHDIIPASFLILATGHSARDIFTLLDSKGVTMVAKDFALGVRIEHPQGYIDSAQYNQEIRENSLPAAAYRVATQVDDNGVFSFCMCPGGLIVPAATAPGELVVNGMSLSRRDSPFANSGFVTSISVEELAEHGYKGLYATLDFQRDVERTLFNAGDGSQKAPAQRALDFVNGKLSPTLNDTSYIPGLWSAPMHELLPEFVYKRLRLGLIQIDKKMKGYLTNDANIVGTESRTSSPIRIPRDQDTYQHPDIQGLYPCGEGAGYAGGILSAAIDGRNVVRKVMEQVSAKD